MHNQTKSIINLDSIIQHLEKKDAILKLLHQHKIAKIKSVESVERYKKDANRGGLIITGKEEINGPIEKILIDFKLGKPCIAQVFDSIYEIGKDCSKRIIMFGGFGKNDVHDPATDEHVVASLITSMNNYPLNLSLVQLNCSNFATELFNMDLVGGIISRPKFSINDLPSKERFREAEFWEVYYDCLNESFYRSWKAFEYGIDNITKYGWKFWNSFLEVKVKWTNEGAFFFVVQTRDSTVHLKEIWQTKKAELQKLFQDQEIQFICLPGKFPKIAIKFWDHPMNCLVNASNAEKMDFAKLLHSKYFDLVGLMDL
jgi:hypothetical protein